MADVLLREPEANGRLLIFVPQSRLRSTGLLILGTFFQSLRLRILLVCLHIIVVIIIVPYSEWTAVAARGQPPVRTGPWAAVLVHATRLVRNLSSAGSRARQELRDEKDLVDCLVWITRVGVKNEHYDNKVSRITSYIGTRDSKTPLNKLIDR